MIHFLKQTIWLTPDNQYAAFQLLGIKTLKIILLAIKGFTTDLCQLRASALTLYTLLSIVPIIALLFGIAKGFGFEKRLQQQLLEKASEQDEMMLQLIEFSQNMLANTQGGLVAGIGIVVLFWSVIKVISNIEESFNHIWKIAKGRTIARKLSDYLSLMMLAPVLLIISSSMTVFVETRIVWLVEVINLPALGTKMVLYAMSCSPLIIMSGLFTFLFIFMPNQKIQLRAGIVAGIATGVMYQVVQWGYLALQLGASSYNAIYGSFAALPLFLLWLQLGWTVVLLGCEISFYVQNFASYRHNEQFFNLSFRLKKRIALSVCHLIVQYFVHKKEAPDAECIAHQLQLPISVVQHTLRLLIGARVIVELKVLEDEAAKYHPAYDLDSLTTTALEEALNALGKNQIAGASEGNSYFKMDFFKQGMLLKEIVLPEDIVLQNESGDE